MKPFLPLVRPKQLKLNSIVYISDFFNSQGDELEPFQVVETGVQSSWPEWCVYRIQSLRTGIKTYSGAYGHPDVLGARIHVSMLEIWSYKIKREWYRIRERTARWLFPEGF